ncbi:MAG: fluoride efflux transporter CrcB [Bacteroidetes bacterium]|nr:MAG: fluoride efflux transporter CrcB [Bacteroidota bacterium]MBL1144990.1 fluoride efflux transporter CrcB [Bacteroidota bacterium]MCB0802103.1 fluoride efflux transporter CrcB [Flavobacteriales bacterium]NOG57786.1 fluoride efflux transporter CrcB [Bacteroidota bacterium]
MKPLIYVFLGGGLGSVIRYLIGRFSLNHFNLGLPLGTFIANMLSCILLGGILLWLKSKNASSDEALKLFLVIGLCGGLSTFSTFSLETFDLLKSGAVLAAVLNVVFSLVFALLLLYFFISKPS